MAQRRIIVADPATEALVAGLVAEAEVGYAPERIRSPRAGRPPLGAGNSRVVQCRVDAATFEALLERARAEDRGVSELVREALEGYLRLGSVLAPSAIDDVARAATRQEVDNDPALRAEASLETLEGFSKGDAEALQKAFNITTIRQLAESPVVLRAQLIAESASQHRRRATLAGECRAASASPTSSSRERG